MENKDFAERNVGLVRALGAAFSRGAASNTTTSFRRGCEGLIKAAATF